MALLRLLLCSLAGLALLAPPALAKDKPPTPYDKSWESFVFDGRQNYPHVLWGVTIDWKLACLKGKADSCLKLARAFEQGFGHVRADQRAAVGYFMEACKQGSGEGCVRAAEMLREGTPGYRLPGLAQQQAERGCTQLKHQPACAALAVSQAAAAPSGSDQSDALLAKACAAGDDMGCRNRANSLFYVRKDAASRTEALRLFELACRARRAWGCLGMFDAYAYGWGVTPDPRKAAEFARSGCEDSEGDRLRLCTRHGMNLLGNRDARSIDRGEGILHAACMANDGLACFLISRWAIGQNPGGKATVKEGYYYARRGCDLGNGEACLQLAMVYDGRFAMARQAEIALPLYQRACRLGESSGCERAEAMLRASPAMARQVPPIDPALPAADQLRRAKAAVDAGNRSDAVMTVVRLMEEGHEDAAWLLGGWMYYGLSGLFGPERKADGLILFENAANVGHIDAAIFMGMAYWYGEGVPQDRAKGEALMGIAAMKGSDKGAAILRSMKAEPIRVDRERRAKEAAEAAERRKNDWTYYWANYRPTWSAPSASYNPYSSGPSVSQIYDNHNFNNAMDYYRGVTSVCAVSNPYC
ncbi:MAG: tetratricopeptide repeat protein [Novosphingobium sp.]